MTNSFIEKNRRTVRLSTHDYSEGGTYFITLKTENNLHLFGFIQSGEMVLNQFGRIAASEWKKTAGIRPSVYIDEYIIMPDHLHGIITIDPSRRGDLRSPIPRSPILQSPNQQSPIQSPPNYNLTPTGGFIFPKTDSLSSILSGFKSAVTRQINQIRKTTEPQIWQRNYYDHIIRESTDLNRVRQYIQNNPSNWRK